MSSKVFGAVVSATLYEKRFLLYYIEFVVVGLDVDGKLYIMSMDLIGVDVLMDDFVVVGDNVESFFGVCESFYKRDLDFEALFEVILYCLILGVNRDCLSGWGGVVIVVIKGNGMFIRMLKSRMD